MPLRFFYYKHFKSLSDFLFSILFVILFLWLILLLIIISSIDTKSWGIFKQSRIGLNKEEFLIYKIKTYQKNNSISVVGAFLRRSKLDEIPQIINILLGDMSFVGPRPDISGFADTLKGKDEIILTVKPGVTGPASIYFKNEEQLLANQDNPELYNRTVIWPQKVKLNIKYVNELSFKNDMYYLIKTFM